MEVTISNDSEATSSARKRPAMDIENILPLYNSGGLPFFGYRMVLTSRLFDRKIAQILAANSNLSLSQWRVLAQLGVVEVGTVRSLAEGAAADRSEVSRVLSKLEKDKVVVRTANEEDLRSPLFSMSEKGQKAYQDIRKPISAFIRELVENVSKEDLEAADRVLKAVASNCS